MHRAGKTGSRLVATFMLGCTLLNYPVLSLFARGAEVAGIPLLFGYVFGVWTLLIGLMALAVELGRR